MYRIFFTPSYSWSHMLKHPKEILWWIVHDVKYFYQRGTRGYSDIDVWNWSSYNATINAAALRQLSDIAHGTPIDYDKPVDPVTGAPEGYTLEEWQGMLNQMAEGFEAHLRIEDRDYPELTLEQHLKHDYKLFEAGMKLYAEHYSELWD